MIHLDPALGHHFLEVAQAQRVRHVPAHAQQDHVQRIVQPLQHLPYASGQRLFRRYLLHYALQFRPMSAPILPRHPYRDKTPDRRIERIWRNRSSIGGSNFARSGPAPRCEGSTIRPLLCSLPPAVIRRNAFDQDAPNERHVSTGAMACKRRQRSRTPAGSHMCEFLSVDINQIVSDLNERGYGAFPSAISLDTLKAIERDATTRTAYTERDPSTTRLSSERASPSRYTVKFRGPSRLSSTPNSSPG